MGVVALERAPAAAASAELVGVVKEFPPRDRGAAPVRALEGVDLTLAEGEFFSVIGPSGCGKSTLLDLIAGLSQPTAGEVRVHGQSTRSAPPAGIGVVFQEDASFPWLTVRQNIAFGLKTLRLPRDEAEGRIQQALTLMGLTAFADTHPAHLSGGMRQRVCIARTLVMRPRMILLDEPFGALDQQTRLLMGDELLKLWRATGATVMLITHSLDEAALLSDRVGIMSARPGRILEVIETGWPADRTSALAGDPGFARITGQLWERLRDQTLRSMGLERGAQ